ncbi:hypothetical protein TrRE_jg3306 [Triparma retinervis]|uniref:PIH1 N-terminal domain-containing protein n=1 Tax=Triparma retinervis TaxID=2557542 RepID=A0A9W6ZZH2_9STRA|nr:hypothetical protein TrRE_jg3306 [Triparma retinervis]
MNLGIQHGGRKGKDRGGGMKLPREVAAMAKQMGIDMSEMGGQAENMWSMLNDMSQNDPQAYEEFIKEQMDGAQEEAEENKKKARTFTPNPSFVVKAKFSNANSGLKIKNAKGVEASGKLFINMCSHDGVQRPLDTQGSPVSDDRPGLDNLQIPLVVGDLRPAADAGGDPVAAVDIVLNPWCIEMVMKNNVFRAQIVELGLNWLQQEQHCKLEKGWKVIKSKYKGGTGDRGDKPVPFPIDESMLDPKDLEKEREREKKAKEELDRIKKGFEEKMGGAGGMPGGKMVEEITPTSCKVVDTTNMTEAEQQRMMEQHAAGPGGGPGAGKTATKKQPAPPKPPTATEGAAPPKPPKDSMKANKGFLEGKSNLYGGKGSMEGEEGSFDLEFQKLMEAADPSFAANFNDPRSKRSKGILGEDSEDALTQALSSMSDIDFGIGPSDGLDMEKLRRNAAEQKYKAKKETLEQRKHAAAALDVEERASAVKGASKKDALAFSLKDGAEGLEVLIKFGEGDGEKLALADMDLEVSEESLRLGTKYGDAWVDLAGYAINEEEVKAKMSQKKRTLKVTLGKK